MKLRSDRWLTASEAATRFGVSRVRVWQLGERGQVRRKALGVRRDWRYNAADLAHRYEPIPC